MSATAHFIRGFLIIAFFAGAIGWFIVVTVRHAEDPARAIFKWIITGVMLGVLFYVAGPIVAKGGYGGAFTGIPLTAVCGLALAITWRRELASLVANPIGSLYDGGSQEPEPRPAYSTAHARHKRGRYLEAIVEIRKQLDRFPTDVEGQLFLAQIQAENLQDLASTEQTIDHLCAQPGHSPKNITFALYSLADWHLSVGHDPEAARRDLERIIQLFPDTESSLGAAQRIAHLSDAEKRFAIAENKTYTVIEGSQNIGLRDDSASLRPAETSPAELAVEYLKHLELHPLDSEAREKLAVLYIEHYQRLDLAADQLEQLITQPSQPAKLVVRWLNLLADLQVRSGADYETVRATLQRIIDRDPQLAAADIARNRLALLKLEIKARGQNEPVKLGEYEQDVGLKRSSPSR